MEADGWRAELDALSFLPPQHRGACLVHRGAFRTLLGFDPTPADCQQWFTDHRVAFHQAAAGKIRSARLGADARFHLTSRDVIRALHQSSRNA